MIFDEKRGPHFSISRAYPKTENPQLISMWNYKNGLTSAFGNGTGYSLEQLISYFLVLFFFFFGNCF